MKFAKYLESESIPEWRKAYINYKGLKKRLKAIEKVKNKFINLFLMQYLFIFLLYL
jgi:SPX domain protein involved in polyphosphate accumulation